MKFTVSQSALAKALAIVSKGLLPSTLPILSGISITASDGMLDLQTTDLTVSVRHKIAANVEDPGQVVIPGRILQSIMRALPDAAVEFEEIEHTVMLKSGRTTYRLNTLPAHEFPEFPQLALGDSVVLPHETLQTMVDKVYRVASKDRGRSVLQGVLLMVEENTLRLVATDSFRLAVCDTHVETSGLEHSFQMIVPGTAFHDVLSLPTESDVIMVGATPSQVVFEFGNTTYVTRRIEGTFPDYKRLLPSHCNTTVQVPLAEFTGALHRVSVIASKNPSIRLDVDADGKFVVLSAVSSDQGDVTEEVNCEIEGNSMPIGLNYHYINDCMTAVSGNDTVALELIDSGSAATFKVFGKINYLYLVMPVRI